MVFIRYQHVERIDAEETEGLLDGVCHVFPKMDGSNMCAYTEDGEVHTMSRNREIAPPEPFASFVAANGNIGRFLRDFPGLRLYGEWMVPHTVRTYVPEVWNRWFVFDVVAEDRDATYEWQGKALRIENGYIPYEDYAPVLEEYGIDFIPPLSVLDRPSVRDLERIADAGNTWMMAEGCGEGVVVKRYGFVNRFGRVSWAKVLNSTFRTFKVLPRGRTADAGTVEHMIAERYVTRDLVDKEHSRIVADGCPKKSVPPRLLNTVYHCILTECIWDAVKRFGSPTVDFRTLKKECETMTKAVCPEVFGLSAVETE